MSRPILQDAVRAEAVIRSFLKASRRPAVLDPGQAPLELRHDNYALEWRGGRLMLEAWNDTQNLVRRIAGVREHKRGRLELIIERFGGRRGLLLLADLERGDRAALERYSLRQTLRERLRRALSRQWPDWVVAELSCEAHLEESLSPAYARAMLRRGRQGWAALMAPSDPSAASGALSFGLLWLDYLRRKQQRLFIQGLILFLPDGSEETTCLRLAWLDPDVAEFRVYVYSEEGGEEPVDPADHGNLDTRLEELTRPHPDRPPLAPWAEGLTRIPGVECVSRQDGNLSLRVRGLEFARLKGSALRFGLNRYIPARKSKLEEVKELARELARLRSAEAADRSHPLYRLQPERWLESQVRANIQRIDASLLPEPIYSQVPAVAGVERGVMDLLAVDQTGRLAVLEIKASADLHLPLQALDYWMRVRWHLERDEFTPRGYFPGIALRPDPPRLLLIAPALEFHPTTETILRYLSPAVDVERVGLGVEWREDLQVVFRVRGAQRPES